MMDSQLVYKAMALKAEIAAKEAELKNLNKQLIDQAVFVDGKKSCTESFPFGSVKVSKTSRVTWDQDKLNIARQKIGDTDFFGLFKWTFSHKDIRSVKDFIKWKDNVGSYVADAMKESDSYSVAFEKADNNGVS